MLAQGSGATAISLTRKFDRPVFASVETKLTFKFCQRSIITELLERTIESLL
jgi:hypothetical protein